MNTLETLLDTGAEVIIRRQRGKTVVGIAIEIDGERYRKGVYTRPDCSVADLLEPGDFINEAINAIMRKRD